MEREVCIFFQSLSTGLFMIPVILIHLCVHFYFPLITAVDVIFMMLADVLTVAFYQIETIPSS